MLSAVEHLSPARSRRSSRAVRDTSWRSLSEVADVERGSALTLHGRDEQSRILEGRR